MSDLRGWYMSCVPLEKDWIEQLKSLYEADNYETCCIERPEGLFLGYRKETLSRSLKKGNAAFVQMSLIR